MNKTLKNEEDIKKNLDEIQEKIMQEVFDGKNLLDFSEIFIRYSIKIFTKSFLGGHHGENKNFSSLYLEFIKTIFLESCRELNKKFDKED